MQQVYILLSMEGKKDDHLGERDKEQNKINEESKKKR